LGPGEVAGAIVDSGPLIHLFEAGCLQLLGVFMPAGAPDEVWHEVASLGHPPEADLPSIGLVREPHPADLGAFIEGESLQRLDRGSKNASGCVAIVGSPSCSPMTWRLVMPRSVSRSGRLDPSASSSAPIGPAGSR
jgi:hypothetical protein